MVLVVSSVYIYIYIYVLTKYIKRGSLLQNNNIVYKDYNVSIIMFSNLYLITIR